MSDAQLDTGQATTTGALADGQAPTDRRGGTGAVHGEIGDPAL